MENKVIYSLQEKNLGENRIVQINESFERLMRKLGARVVNSSYILSEGRPTEAYGYYVFAGWGAVKTILDSSNSECNLSVNFIGFDREIESYNKLKMYIENTLKKVMLYSEN
jgi:hypothetical protein